MFRKPADRVIPGFSEPDARRFLLCVGMVGKSYRFSRDAKIVAQIFTLYFAVLQRNFILCTILEAGGCASACDETQPMPDPFYVDQAKSVLLQLLSRHVDAQCDNRCPQEWCHVIIIMLFKVELMSLWSFAAFRECLFPAQHPPTDSSRSTKSRRSEGRPNNRPQ